ncbi:eCIS core domain-containing protein [Streptomyces montanisoli]|uniref:DUF4157 domain-containing protein n=1 Tax=Streptomyces montanisoli TaxID=2798581 RepID=A0A940MBS3_9ACTN|nr:DUF4157 domain-containing protein [Streptomyces montanisoli]MBP0458072.1 DUF4157 domain-containing protein [Streptomyces montanisoli]
MRAQERPDKDQAQAGPRKPAPAIATGAVQRLLASGGRMSPHQVGALQGMAGNAAVVQRLARDGEQEQHEHSGDCGHAPAVQRSTTVPQVLGMPGQSFADHPFRPEMETRFGRPLSHLRHHTDAAAQRSAHEIDAEAYTSGHHMVFTPAAMQNKETVAHEIVHALDQEEGEVPGTDQGNGLKMSSPKDSGETSAVARARDLMSKPLTAFEAPRADDDEA